MQEKTINFLDLNIKFDPITCKLIFSMYIKPTNRFGYLRTNSNHPSFVYKNIPLSIMIRARRICSNYADYLFFARLFSFHLVNRGYAMNQLMSIAYSLGTQDRLSLIPYKDKNERIGIKAKSSIYFGIAFDKTVEKDMMDSISKSFNKIKSKNDWLNNY